MGEQPSPKTYLGSTAQEWVVTLVAIIALAAFAVFISYLLRQIAATDQEWARMIYLLSGIEAIVFAAAGFLFGREVHRKRADDAEAEVSAATQTAHQANLRAVQAEGAVKAIVNQIDVKRASYQTKSAMYAALDVQQTARITQEDLEELAMFAAKYISS